MSKIIDISLEPRAVAARAAAVVAIAVFAAFLAIPLSASAATSCAEAGSDPTAAQYCTTPTVPPGESEVKGVSESSSSSEANAEAEAVAVTGSSSCAGSAGSSNGSGSAGSSNGSGSAGGSGCGSGGPSAAAASGSLPFTGADLLTLAAMAAALLAVGVALRRMSRTEPESR